MFQKLSPLVSDLQEASALLSGAIQKLEGVRKIDTVQVIQHLTLFLFCLKTSHLQSKVFINKSVLFLCKDGYVKLLCVDQDVQQCIEEQGALMKDVLEDTRLVGLQRGGGAMLGRLRRETEVRSPDCERSR